MFADFVAQLNQERGPIDIKSGRLDEILRERLRPTPKDAWEAIGQTGMSFTIGKPQQVTASDIARKGLSEDFSILDQTSKIAQQGNRDAQMVMETASRFTDDPQDLARIIKALHDDGEPVNAGNITTKAATAVQRLGIRAKPKGGTVSKPLPIGALRMQQELLEGASTARGTQAVLAEKQKQLEEGKLNLGPLNNAIADARNFVGLSNTSSRNYSSFVSSLEKLRNDSLRLNKGTQTEGDAQRAWNELMANINDEKLVQQRLSEITQINERAVTERQNQLDVLRSNYGADSIPVDLQGNSSNVQENVPPPISDTPSLENLNLRDYGNKQEFEEGDVAENPETGERIIYRKGQWEAM